MNTSKNIAEKLKKIPNLKSISQNLSDELTPKEIVKQLDQYIIGQQDAKKAVAIALRNRARRKLVSDDLQGEIYPKNILMIGNTGVGKTEIARRLAKLSDAPFIKVEATKFTEVGYVGRDVESMIRDLLNVAINECRIKMLEKVEDNAKKQAEEKILDILFPIQNTSSDTSPTMSPTTSDKEVARLTATREKMKSRLEKGDFDKKEIEIDTPKPSVEMGVTGISGAEDMQNMEGMIKNIMQMIPSKHSTNKRKVTVEQARNILAQELGEALIDRDKINQQAIEKTENMGIVFLDEIDKVVTKKGNSQGVDVSREGVQRDILPLVEGSVVNTRHGAVNTDHILFIAAGAFHISSPSDIIPELQGRFPIRVELKSLGQDEMEQILKEPKNSLLKQYKALLQTEGVNLEFTPKAIKEIARISCEVNDKTHNIGARRLSTVLEKLLEDYLFDATKVGGKIKIDEQHVHDVLNDIVEDEDLSRYIL